MKSAVELGNKLYLKLRATIVPTKLPHLDVSGYLGSKLVCPFSGGSPGLLELVAWMCAKRTPDDVPVPYWTQHLWDLAPEFIESDLEGVSSPSLFAVHCH